MANKTVEEYIQTRKDIIKEIDNLRLYLKRVERDYISEYREFADGEAVVVEVEDQKYNAYVRNCGILEISGKLIYRLVKAKKNGLPSSHRFDPWDIGDGKYTITRHPYPKHLSGTQDH